MPYSYEESGLTLRHRPLSYWLDYLRAFAGTDASVLIVQSQCDTRDKRVLHPPATVDDFPFHRYTEVSARTGLNLESSRRTSKKLCATASIGARLIQSAQDA